jgi:hypothetical protein
MAFGSEGSVGASTWDLGQAPVMGSAAPEWRRVRSIAHLDAAEIYPACYNPVWRE